MDQINLHSIAKGLSKEIREKVDKIIESTEKHIMKYDVSQPVPSINDLNLIITCNGIQTGEISDPPKGENKSFIYMLFDQTMKKCLYVGKSKKIRTRLEQHLVINLSKSTASKIEQVKKYIQDKNEVLYFCVLEVFPPDIYGAVEGQIIEYIEETQYDEETIQYFWNTRHD